MKSPRATLFRLLVLCVVFCWGGGARVVAQESAHAWFEAARMGDIAELQRHLAAGTDINRPDQSARTALHHALGQSQSEAARFLIEAGADIQKEANHRRPLNWAIQAGDVANFRLLIAKGADPRFKTRYGPPPLEEAIMWGRLEMVRELERQGVTAARENMEGMALVTAARFGYPDLAFHYLEKGVKPGMFHGGSVALDEAAFTGNIPLMEELLRRGAGVNEVSRGQMLAHSLGGIRTPLITAVISDEREAVSRLLRAKADPRALNGRAAVWADLKGDEVVYRELIRAGAAEAQPFAFADWLKPGSRGEEAAWAGVSTDEALIAQIARLGGWRPGSAVPMVEYATVPEGTRIAVVMTDEALANAEALLTARLSAMPGAVLLERTEVRRLMAERKLGETLARGGGEAAAGRLLGADILVILRTQLMEDKKSLHEARVVATRTGVIAGTAFRAPQADKVERWIDEVVGHCQVAGDLAGAKAEGTHHFIAMPRVVASLNTPAARALERQTGLLLAAFVSRLQGVYLVEREELDRLSLERDPSGAAYAASTWIIDARLDTPLAADGDVKLVLTLRNAARGGPEELVMTGPAASPEQLAAEGANKIGVLLGTRPLERMDPGVEARVFLEKGKRFARISLWSEAGAAAESAWALGLQSDDVTRLRLFAPVNRIQFLDKFLIPQKRKRLRYSGIAELVSFRAPLLMPKEDPRELGLDDYLDLANRALDAFAASLPGLGDRFGGEPADQWLCGEVWDAATVPLRMTEPLSYQRTHGEVLDALRGRLIALHEEALRIAHARRDARAVQTLVGLKIKHLSWWQPDEAKFQAGVREMLATSTTWAPPLSEQSAWGVAWMIGKDHMAMVSGRAGKAWQRLARELAASDETRERFLGRALLAMHMTKDRHHVDALNWMREEFPRLNELDRGINTRVFASACQMRPAKPFLDIAMRPWYEKARADLLSARVASSNHIGPADAWAAKMTSETGVVYPEVRNFQNEQTRLRLETILSEGPGGLFLFSSTGRDVAELKPLYDEALVVFDELHRREPQTIYAFRSLEILTLHGFAQHQVVVAPGGLDGGKIRNPFVDMVTIPDSMKVGFAAYLPSDSPWRQDTDGWLIAHTSAWDADSSRRVESLWKTFAFRMGKDGRPVDVRELPASVVMTYREMSGGMGIRANDRWLVFAGRNRGTDGKTTGGESIVAMDLRAGAWTSRTYASAGTERGLRDMRLAGDLLVYSFVHNPTGPKSGDDEMLEKSGEPTFGVVEIDLSSGRETLLASSRREPAVSPLEGERLGVFYRIGLIGETAFNVRGRSGASRHAFDLESREWRSLTDEDRKALAGDGGRAARTMLIEAGGRTWHLYMATRKNHLRVHTGRENDFLDIPLSFDYGSYETEFQAYRGAVKKSQRHRARDMKPIVATPHGLMVWLSDGFYFWLPMDKVKAAIADTHARKQSGAAASSAP